MGTRRPVLGSMGRPGKVSRGTCGRPYGTPCRHEHACIRFPFHRANGWLGEVEGLQVSFDTAMAKLNSLKNSPPTDALNWSTSAARLER
ncbi:hypothetical protein [Streptomyces sp. NPDC003710]